MKKKSKIFLLVILIISLLLISTYLFFNRGNTKIINSTETNLIYKEDDTGFSIQYPKKWMYVSYNYDTYIDSWKTKSVAFRPIDLEVNDQEYGTILANEFSLVEEKDLSTFISKYFCYEPGNCLDIDKTIPRSVSGLSAVTVENFSGPLPSEDVVFMDGNSFYIFSIIYEGSYDKETGEYVGKSEDDIANKLIFEEMLSSFIRTK